MMLALLDFIASFFQGSEPVLIKALTSKFYIFFLDSKKIDFEVCSGPLSQATELGLLRNSISSER